MTINPIHKLSYNQILITSNAANRIPLQETLPVREPSLRSSPLTKMTRISSIVA